MELGNNRHTTVPGPTPWEASSPATPSAARSKAANVECPARMVDSARLDVGLDVAVHLGRGPEDLDYRGVLSLNLTRRHIGGDCNSVADLRSPGPVSADDAAGRRIRVPWFVPMAVVDSPVVDR